MRQYQPCHPEFISGSSRLNKNMSEYFAEIIESNLSNFIAQSWDLKITPAFASLVETKSNNQTIYGIVTNIQTGSSDPMHYPFTYKKTEEELKKEQPQIFEFLKTTFNVQIIGYKRSEKTFNVEEIFNVIEFRTPVEPPMIHSFVKNSTQEIIKKVFQDTQFLSLLFTNQIQNIDDILLVILKDLKEKKLVSKNYIHNFCNQYSLLTGNDYKRLKLFLNRI